jgi:hypothetical protein
VRFRVVLGGLVGVVLGVCGMALGCVRMVRRRLVVTGFMLFRRLAVMLGSGFVVLSGLLVVFGAVVRCHCHFPVGD